MVFRADESIENGYEQAKKYLILRDLEPSQRSRSEAVLENIIEQCGPVIQSYPSWHPLVSKHDQRHPVTRPNSRCGYRGLDHTVCFVSGFVTCPYGDGQKVIDSVTELSKNSAAFIKAERLDVKFYNPGTTPILIKCEWEKPLSNDGTIPLSLAVALLLEQEIPCRKWAEVAETWETMRHYFLGEPHGSRSSLFVNQKTGQAMKKIWNSLIQTGIFGPIKV